MKREKIRQVFKERFIDFDEDNNCVTTFVLGKNTNGLWHVKLSSSIKIIHYGLYDVAILYDIKERCEWVGDYFYCRVEVIADVRKNVHIIFHPLNDIN